jgi:tripartite-type tricarboxylate transporter receptor subunit TctC
MPGAGGNVARAYVYAQPPDGYTLLVSLQPSMSAGQIVTGAKFDTLKLTHVYNITGGNYDGVAVPMDSPWKTIDDLKKASQAQPLTSAGSGIGTNPYILAMLLKTRAGINLIFVPFNSGAEAALAVAGGQTQMGTAQVDSLWPLHEAKKLRILAVGGPERDKSHPEFPTMVELGYPDIKIDSMIGIFGPPGIPKDRLDVLAAGCRKAMANPKLHAAAKTAGVSLQPMEPAEFYKASSALFSLVREMEPLLKPAKR